MDKEIEKYIAKQSPSQKEILRQVRAIILKVLPGCQEAMAWGVITFARKKIYLAAMKNRVHVGFSIRGLDKEEIKSLEGGGKTMRHIKIPDLKSMDKTKLKKMIRLVNKKAKCVEC